MPYSALTVQQRQSVGRITVPFAFDLYSVGESLSEQAWQGLVIMQLLYHS